MKNQKIDSYLLFKPKSELVFGEKIKSYKVDKSNTEFYFFPKCQEEVLDVDVYEIPSGELHVVDSLYGSPKRFIYSAEKNDELLKLDHVIELNFKEGFVYVSKSCRYILRYTTLTPNQT
jgi:hypothetical protein